MKKNEKIIERIKEQGMIPLFYHEDADVCYEAVKALYAAGVTIVEFTNRGKNALSNFHYLLEKRDEEMPDMLLAAGTIKTVKEARHYIKAGADFIISPGIVKEVGEKVHDAGLFWIPGCMTATEIMLAEECDARLVKLFPGSLLGPGFMTAIRELFPALLFMPTGGVEIDRDNLKAWLDAGVCAVGMGSKMISKNILLNKDYEKITQLAKQAMGIIGEVRKG